VSSNLPHVALKNQSNARILRESKAYPYRQVGWLVLDCEFSSSDCSKLREHARFLVVGIRPRSGADSLDDSVIFGLFLLPSGAIYQSYKRIRAGIMSSSHMILSATRMTKKVLWGIEEKQEKEKRDAMNDEKFWTTVNLI
jgi:hypothetical protein